MNRRIKRKIAYLAASLLLVTLYLAKDGLRILVEGGPGPDSELVRVVRVYDGDTLSIIYRGTEEKVRLIGIDAPEMGQRPWGKRAKRRLEELVAESGWRVLIETDVERRDRYGRLLAYARDKNNRLLNYRMVEEGYAFLYTVPPNVKHVEALRAAQKSAREAKRGVWGKTGLREMPSKYRERTR